MKNNNNLKCYEKFFILFFLLTMFYGQNCIASDHDDSNRESFASHYDGSIMSAKNQFENIVIDITAKSPNVDVPKLTTDLMNVLDVRGHELQPLDVFYEFGCFV